MPEALPDFSSIPVFRSGYRKHETQCVIALLFENLCRQPDYFMVFENPRKGRIYKCKYTLVAKLLTFPFRHGINHRVGNYNVSCFVSPLKRGSYPILLYNNKIVVLDIDLIQEPIELTEKP